MNGWRSLQRATSLLVVCGWVARPGAGVAAGQEAPSDPKRDGPHGGESRLQDPRVAERRAIRTGRELIRAGSIPAALVHLRGAVARNPECLELRRLLGAAALDRAIELDNQTSLVETRLALGERLKQAVDGDERGVVSEFRELLTTNRAGALTACRENRAAAAEAEARLAEAEQQAERAMGREPPGIEAATLLLWVRAYRVARVQRLGTLDLAREGMPDVLVSAVGAGQAPLDTARVRRQSLALLSRCAKKEPESPLPYLLAAEWILFARTEAERRSDPLERARLSRFALPPQLRARFGAPAAKAPPSRRETVRGMDAAMLGRVVYEDLYSLYERAAALDTRGEPGILYGWYVLVASEDADRALGFLRAVERRDAGNALARIERARHALADDADPDAVLTGLQAAASLGRLRRPLFTTMPEEVRVPLLSAHMVWKNTERATFGLNAVAMAINRMAREAVNAKEKQRILLVKAGLGALLMQSDLPSDWAVGAEMRHEALSALHRLGGVPQAPAARLQMEMERTRAVVAARSWPLKFAIAWRWQVHLRPVVALEEIAIIEEPCVIATVDGTTMMGR